MDRSKESRYIHVQKSNYSDRKEYVSPIRFLVCVLLVCGTCIALLHHYTPLSGLQIEAATPELSYDENPEAIWSSIPPSVVDDLSWVPCYVERECAKLIVPLDYAKLDTGNATIAMVKVPSKVRKSSSKYRGPVLFNPGGPGGSGVALLAGERGKLLQSIIGDEYDLISFDPRGVGRTDPVINIFPDEAEGTMWRLLAENLPLPNITEDAVTRRHAQSILYGNLAAARTMHAAPYLSTALVCRDMLEIMRAHGRDKLQYWGFSYGTILGATFAAMFPDHVERLIIDGVADSYDYYATLWSNNLVDTDKTLNWFFTECSNAGPELCAFHEPSVMQIQQRYSRLLSNLKKKPIAVPAPMSLATTIDYGVVDYALVLKVVFGFLYKPYSSQSTPVSSTALANALAAAERGDGLPFWELQKSDIETLECRCARDPDQVPLYKSADAVAGISCSDGEIVNDSPEELQALFDRMAEDSAFALLWGGRIRCAGWKVRSVERFAGPFIGNTSFPILLIGNMADPVTPVRNAHFMSKGFKGSVVLTQNSAGHCSLAATSTCTAKAVREYFRYGKLPDTGTVCEVESKMFLSSNETYDAIPSTVPSEDHLLRQAWEKLSDIFEPPRYGM